MNGGIYMDWDKVKTVGKAVARGTCSYIENNARDAAKHNPYYTDEQRQSANDFADVWSENRKRFMDQFYKEDYKMKGFDKNPDRTWRNNNSDGKIFYGFDSEDGKTSWYDKNGILDSVTDTPSEYEQEQNDEGW